MLRPLILTFLIFYLNDWLPLSLAGETCVFLLEYFYGTALWWQFLAQLPIGLALATLLRWLQRRLELSALLLPRLPDIQWLVDMAHLLCIGLATLLYTRQIDDPGDALPTKFYSGPLEFLCFATIITLVLVSIGYAFGDRRCNFRLAGVHPTCVLVLCVLVAIDMMSFLEGYIVVPVIAGIVLAMHVTGAAFTWAIK